MDTHESRRTYADGRFSAPQTAVWGLALALVFGFTAAACKQDADDKDGDTKKKPIRLTADTWADGNIAGSSSGGSGEQWFSFTANASTQYIHISFGTIGTYHNTYIQLYDRNDYPVGSNEYLYATVSGASDYISRTLSNGSEYYIKVSSIYTGTYKIAFSDTFRKPETTITPLDKDVWANGNIVGTSSGGDGTQWFKFTATAATQYIHISFGTIGTYHNTYIQLYDLDDYPVGSNEYLYATASDASDYISRTLSNGSEYYIKVSSIYTGTYKIAFSDSTAQPSS